MEPIKLMKSTFYKETEVKANLIKFISGSQRLSMGEMCTEFEQTFAKYQSCRHAVLFNSGSSANLALIQAYLNMGRLKAGDTVAISAVTWATNPMPLFQLGLQVVPLDVELETLNVSSKILKKALAANPEIKAFFITNLLGFCDDIDEIAKVCAEKNILFFEDNCESLGTIYKNKKLGNFGNASTFSMFVGHHLSSIEGGIVCTDNLELANMLKMTRAHGWSRNLDETRREHLRKENSINHFYDSYTFYELGYNLRPTEITGFLGLEQLKYADEVIGLRENNFHQFHKTSLSSKSIFHLKIDHISKVSNFAFPIVCKDKSTLDKYIGVFNREWIEIRPLVGGNIARQPFFQRYCKKKYELPNSDLIHDHGFYFPNNPELTLAEKERISTALSSLD